MSDKETGDSPVFHEISRSINPAISTRNRKLLFFFALTLCVLATAILSAGSSTLSRVLADRRAGLLEQSLSLFIHRITRPARQAIARQLGVGERSPPLEDADNRASLPEFRVIPAEPVENLTPAASALPRPREEWFHSLGDNSATKFSGLDLIDRSNIGRLVRAWVYEGEGEPHTIQATPIYTGRAVVFPDSSDRIIAVDPSSGRTLWKFDPGLSLPARRGLAFYEGDDGSRRIFFTARGMLFAVNALDGTPDSDFNGGSVAIGYESRVAPMVVGNMVAVASFRPAVHVFSAETGNLQCELDYLEQFDSRSTLERLLAASPSYGGASAWGGMAVDEERRIAFLSTSNPTPVGVGIDRPGDNKPTVSVVAIALETCELLWTFQGVRHDLWDLDMASPPVLATISRGGRRVDVVVAASKSGNVLLLDRTTGKPVFDFRLRRAPASSVAGEVTAPYQPDPELPRPFARMAFTPDDVTDIGPENRASVLAQIGGASMGFYPPHRPEVPTVFFGLHGGAMHYGTSLDPRTGVMFVAASHVPSMFTITDGSRSRSIAVEGAGGKSYRAHCAACHGEDLEGTDGAPPLGVFAGELAFDYFKEVVRNGVRRMPPVHGISEDEITAIYRMIGRKSSGIEDEKADPDADNGHGRGLRRTVYRKLRDHEGYPGSRPPWGTLTAIDLNTGLHRWRVPLGRHDELIARGIPQTGTENISGSMATAGGLVFASGTKDRLIRAFDIDTGEELWEAELPFIGTASPMTYVHQGRQYVLVAATGGGTLALYDGTVQTGRSFVAFALPE